jgi:membrane-associated phospholipid phosphatase
VKKIKPYLEQTAGMLGTVWCLAIFIHEPSFPTPDKLLIFLAFVFMIFKQLVPMLKRLLPFVVILLTYESFRSFANKLNSHVDYLTAPHFDKFVFGNLLTVYLQNLLWTGHVRWYDFVFYLAYMLHFIIPIGLAILVWKTREKYYWRVVTTYLVCAFAAFITFFLLPAAPPWLASENHYIQPIVRISSDVWASLGLHDFPSVYNHLSPNPVAAIPSLHAAWATLLVIFAYTLYGKRWALLASTYPFLIYVGTIYEGEHYAFDVIAGIVYAFAAYSATPYILRAAARTMNKLIASKTLQSLQVKFRKPAHSKST